MLDEVDVVVDSVVLVEENVLVVVVEETVTHGANFWTRLVLSSETRTFPVPSTATPKG